MTQLERMYEFRWLLQLIGLSRGVLPPTVPREEWIKGQRFGTPLCDVAVPSGSYPKRPQETRDLARDRWLRSQARPMAARCLVCEFTGVWLFAPRGSRHCPLSEAEQLALDRFLVHGQHQYKFRCAAGPDKMLWLDTQGFKSDTEWHEREGLSANQGDGI